MPPGLAFWPVPFAILTLKVREFNGTEVPNCAELIASELEFISNLKLLCWESRRRFSCPAVSRR